MRVAVARSTLPDLAPFRRFAMPARVEFRLGSIFDEPCDMLVIPSSAGGTVTPELQGAIRAAGLPFPGAMPLGSLSVALREHPLYGAVVYATSVSGQTSSAEIIEQIGSRLGRFVNVGRIMRISAPLLGAGSGDLPDEVATGALARGFMSTAPAEALLVISIRDRERLKALARIFPSAVGNHIRYAPDPPLDPQTDTTEGWSARREREAAVEGQPTASTPMAPGKPSARRGVFVSYSHADAEWLERLQKHLKPLQREGVDVWDDTRLKAGEQWREEIREALAATKVAILLISADFLASDFIVTDELPPLLKAAEEDGATILPVIVSASRFLRIESLARFQAVNDPAKPLVQMSRGNREKVLDQVACAVEDALKR